NQGQSAAQVRYLAHGSGYALFLTGQGAVLSLQKPAVHGPGATPTGGAGVALALNLVGGNPRATVAGLDRLPGTSHYFIRNHPRQWHSNVANSARVEYQGVYPGIDLVYYGNQRQLEYDFVVAPGADPGRIRFSVAGALGIRLDGKGELVLHTASGDV